MWNWSSGGHCGFQRHTVHAKQKTRLRWGRNPEHAGSEWCITSNWRLGLQFIYTQESSIPHVAAPLERHTFWKFLCVWKVLNKLRFPMNQTTCSVTNTNVPSTPSHALHFITFLRSPTKINYIQSHTGHMGSGKGERMERIWHVRFPCVLLTRRMILSPGWFRCYRKAKYRNTIGTLECESRVSSRVTQMYTWVRGEQSLSTHPQASALWWPLLMRCDHSRESEAKMVSGHHSHP